MANNRFGKRGAFECIRCTRATRETGVQSDQTEMCPQCHEISEIENAWQDGTPITPEKRVRVETLARIIFNCGGKPDIQFLTDADEADTHHTIDL